MRQRYAFLTFKGCAVYALHINASMDLKPFMRQARYAASQGGRRQQGFRSLSQIVFCPVFIKLGDYVGGHNISTKFYNMPPPGTPELWPLNCPKTELAVSALKVEYPAPKNVAITIEFTTNTACVFCVSLALSLCIVILFIADSAPDTRATGLPKTTGQASTSTGNVT